MIESLPLNAATIRLEWPIEQGGFGITARTDWMGTAIIGLYPLNPESQSPDQAFEIAHQHLLFGVVVGDDDRHKVTVVFADIMVTPQGLALRIVMPPHMVERGYDRYLFAPWNHPAPQPGA